MNQPEEIPEPVRLCRCDSAITMFGNGVLEGHLNNEDEDEEIIIELHANPLPPRSRARSSQDYAPVTPNRIPKDLTIIDYLVKYIPSCLMQNMDPISTIQLRRALGGETWMSPLERVKYASIAAILGINMDWLTFVSRAGCHVALLGANLLDVQLAIDGRDPSSVEQPFRIINDLHGAPWAGASSFRGS